MRDRWPAAVGVAIPILVTLAFLGATSPPQRASTFSFEADLEGWTVGATDLSSGNCTGGGMGNCTADWSVGRTIERAQDGTASVRLYLNNTNDQGKIWIERPFNVTTGRTYRVHVAFALASADFGSVNRWTILAGALSEEPATSGSLAGVHRGDTGNGLESYGGYVWMEKTYDSTAAPVAGGQLWVVVGIWGTWETARTYYVDAIQVTIEGI
jgi:hypothetical protein